MIAREFHQSQHHLHSNVRVLFLRRYRTCEPLREVFRDNNGTNILRPCESFLRVIGKWCSEANEKTIEQSLIVQRTMPN